MMRKTRSMWRKRPWRFLRSGDENWASLELTLGPCGDKPWLAGANPGSEAGSGHVRRRLRS